MLNEETMFWKNNEQECSFSVCLLVVRSTLAQIGGQKVERPYNFVLWPPLTPDSSSLFLSYLARFCYLLLRCFGPVRAFVRHLHVKLAIRVEQEAKCI